MSQEIDVSNENELAKLLNENNSLEKKYLEQLYRHISKDRPIQIRNIFAEIEEDAYKNDSMMNSDFLSDSISQYDTNFLSLQDEIDELSAFVDNQRQDLHQIICKIDATHALEENSASNEQPSEKYSQQIEDLARKVAYSIDDVDEKQLIQYLARGPARQSEQDILDKTYSLCEKKYELNQLKITKKMLTHLNNQIMSLQTREHSWEQQHNPNSELLSDAFDVAASNISEITSEDQLNEDSQIDKKWEALQEMSKDIRIGREQLFNYIKSENEIPLPQEFTLPEKEKEALEQTLDSLIESNRLLTEYLQSIREKGIVESMILPPDEVRDIFDQYNELKQRNHE